MERPSIRTFSLFDTERRRRGGRAGGRGDGFLASIGRFFHLILEKAADGLTSKYINKGIRSFGQKALNVGANALSSLAQGESVRDVGKKTLKRALTR